MDWYFHGNAKTGNVCIYPPCAPISECLPEVRKFHQITNPKTSQDEIERAEEWEYEERHQGISNGFKSREEQEEFGGYLGPNSSESSEEEESSDETYYSSEDGDDDEILRRNHAPLTIEMLDEMFEEGNILLESGELVIAHALIINSCRVDILKRYIRNENGDISCVHSRYVHQSVSNEYENSFHEKYVVAQHDDFRANHELEIEVRKDIGDESVTIILLYKRDESGQLILYQRRTIRRDQMNAENFVRRH